VTGQTIACTLAHADQINRSDRWRKLTDAASGRVVETRTGLRLSFRSSPSAERELAELAALERECCAFATWTVREAGQELVLDVEADGDAVAAIHGMFRALRGAA
jgi:hypothetical protein